MMLLIYPPFAMPDKPYIGLPTLSGYLQKQGIPVTIWDANLRLFQHLMAPETLAQQMQVYHRRLQALDEHADIDPSWAEAYFIMALAIGLNGADSEKGFTDLFNDPSLSNKERLRTFRRYILLHAAADQGESVYMAENTGYITYKAPVSFFSSQRLVEYAWKPDTLIRRFLSPDLDRYLRDEEHEKRPTMIGISVTFPEQIAPALILAAMIRERTPHIPVMLGGAFASVHLRNYTGQALFSLVDYIALGDGELLLERFSTFLAKGAKDRRGLKAPEHIAGLIFQREGQTVKTQAPEPVPMAQQERPAYTLLPLSDYLFPLQANATLFQLSRGCYWARCAFCNCRAALIRGFERMNPVKVYERLKKTLADTDSQVIHFTDDAADPDTLDLVARELIQEKKAVDWTVNVRADKHLTLERLLLYRQAGCFSLFIGIESYNDRLLQLMKKGISCKSISQSLSNISWSGISANIYMIVGFPTETEAEARASFETVLSWLKQGLVRQVVYNIFTISPCSPVMQNPEAYSISIPSSDPDQDLTPPVSQFTCRTGMDREKVRKLYNEFNRRLRELNASDNGVAAPSSLPWAQGTKFRPEAIREVLDNAHSTP